MGLSEKPLQDLAANQESSLSYCESQYLFNSGEVHDNLVEMTTREAKIRLHYVSVIC